MNKYFSADIKDTHYFSDTVTSSVGTDVSKKKLGQEKQIEPRLVFQKAISGYGVKRSGVVRRRYGIK